MPYFTAKMQPVQFQLGSARGTKPYSLSLQAGSGGPHHYAVGKGREAKEETEDGREGTPTFSDANDYQYIKDLCENFDQLLELWLDVVAEPTTVLSPHGHPKI